MSDFASALQGSNIVDQLCSKQIELKALEVELQGNREALDKERQDFRMEVETMKGSVEVEKALLAQGWKEMQKEEAAQALEYAQYTENAKVQADSILARATYEAVLIKEAATADLAIVEAKSAAEAAATVVALEVDKAKLAADTLALAKEVTEARAHEARYKGRVDLDVGGARFSTSVETLTTAGSPFFTSMFSGAWKRDGSAIFIDRDPVMFEKILRYLRYGCNSDILIAAVKEMTAEERIALMAEATYFQLDDAVEVINANKPGASADLQALAQIVGKRLKVGQTNSYGRVVPNDQGLHVTAA